MRRTISGNELGCYPIRPAFELFGRPHQTAWGTCVSGWHGIDLEPTAVLGYSDGRGLVLSCGMNRRSDTFARLLCSDGEIRMSNLFHPSDGDRLEILGRESETSAAAPHAEPSFSAAIRHIQAVLGGTGSRDNLPSIRRCPPPRRYTTCTLN